jgi:hypothetical protein
MGLASGLKVASLLGRELIKLGGATMAYAAANVRFTSTNGSSPDLHLRSQRGGVMRMLGQK